MKDMEDIKGMITAAKRMLAAKETGSQDREGYMRMVDFAIRNESRLRQDAEFAELKDLLEEVAAKGGFRSPRSIQEGFGLNSCAQ